MSWYFYLFEDHWGLLCLDMHRISNESPELNSACQDKVKVYSGHHSCCDMGGQGLLKPTSQCFGQFLTVPRSAPAPPAWKTAHHLQCNWLARWHLEILEALRLIKTCDFHPMTSCRTKDGLRPVALRVAAAHSAGAQWRELLNWRSKGKVTPLPTYKLVYKPIQL